MPHPDDRTLTPADLGTLVHDDALGRIMRHGDTFDAWDAKGEYLGGFDSQDRAYIALIEASDVHQSLIDAYRSSY